MQDKRQNPEHKEHILDGIKNALLPLMLVAGMVFCALWIYEQASTQYSWQWTRVWRYLGTFQTFQTGNAETGTSFSGVFHPGLLLKGLGITLLLVLYGFVLTVFFAFILVFMKLSQSPVLTAASQAVISLIRNTPLLIQLFLWYFVFADIFGLNPFATAVLCLALFEGVYLAEILRGGIMAVPHTQWEASFSLGMTLPKTLFHVILPQVFRNVLPSLGGQFISLIKDTSLVSAIAVADLTLQARTVISETYLSFEIWLLVACLYFALTLLISIPFFLLTKHFAKQSQK